MADKMLWVKIWHWTNGALCLILIITGLQMQYSGFGFTFISFEASVVIHNLCGGLLVLSYIGFIIGNIKSRNIKNYKIEGSELSKDIWVQARYYAIGIFKGDKEPFPIGAGREFNPLQKLSYIIIMYACIPLIIITGLAMAIPDIIPDHIFGMVGFLVTDILHVTVAFMVSIFLIIHLYFAYFHGFSNKH
jgi:thiosulfate reductase cytochrome b subunit